MSDSFNDWFNSIDPQTRNAVLLVIILVLVYYAYKGFACKCDDKTNKTAKSSFMPGANGAFATELSPTIYYN